MFRWVRLDNQAHACLTGLTKVYQQAWWEKPVNKFTTFATTYSNLVNAKTSKVLEYTTGHTCIVSHFNFTLCDQRRSPAQIII